MMSTMSKEERTSLQADGAQRLASTETGGTRSFRLSGMVIERVGGWES